MKCSRLECAALAALTMGLAIGANAEPSITGVTAQQRYPWNGKVDIAYTASGVAAAAEAAGMAPALKVMAIDRTTTPWTTNTADSACLFVGPYATEALADAAATSDGTHQIVWDMNAQGLTFASSNVVFAVLGVTKEKPLVGVQLWKDGPYWAECNVGASKPQDSGYYFWWGDTVGYKYNSTDERWDAVDGSATGFQFSESNGQIATYNKSIDQLKEGGFIDDATNLVAKYDAATKYLGAPWRMPTDAEMQALVDNCTTTWTNNWNGTGVNGRLVTGTGDYASKSIFLPAAGYGDDSDLYNSGSYGIYWSSTPDSGDSYNVRGLFFLSGYFYRYIDFRYYGFSVRPVGEFAE